jgi:hypothetical protein
MVALAATNDDDLPVFRNLVAEAGKIGPGVGVRRLQHIGLL